MSAPAGQQGFAPVNKRTAWKILASVVVVVGAVGGLLWASTSQGAEYYKFVDEVTSNPAALRAKRVKVHGYVVKDSIEQVRGTLQYRFAMETRPPRAPSTITAHYRGLVPDTFKSESEVVATGLLGPNNELQADKIEAKCPSKYDAKGPDLNKLGAAAPANPAARTY